MPLDFVATGDLDLVPWNNRRDRLDRLLEAELVQRHRCLLLRELDHEHAPLLLENRLEGLDVGIDVDRQGVGDTDWQRHDPVQSGTLLIDDNGASSLGFEPLDEGAHIGEVLRDSQALSMRLGIDVRFAGFELSVPEAVEDTQVRPVRREVEVERDDRSFIMFAGDVA